MQRQDDIKRAPNRQLACVKGRVNMQKIDLIFLRVGALYLTFGIASELILYGTRYDLLPGAHAHIYMIGAGLHVMFGLIYCHWPTLKLMRLARIHSTLFLIGSPLLIGGFLLPQQTEMNNPVLFGSLFILLSCFAFTLIVFNIPKNSKAAKT